MKVKKFIYITASAVLGLFLSFILHGIIEIFYLKFADAKNLEVTWTNGCALPIWLIYLLPILGIGGGIWLGFSWFKIIYLKRRGRSGVLKKLIFILTLLALVALVWLLNFLFV